MKKKTVEKTEFTEEVEEEENTRLNELQTEYDLVKKELEDLKIEYATLVEEKRC